MIINTEFQNSCDKVFIYCFMKSKKFYLSQVRDYPFAPIFFASTKFDYFPSMHAKLRGMAKLSVRKYGIYNKAINGRNLFEVFPWLNDRS